MTTPARQSISSSARQAGVCDACGAGIVIQFFQVALMGNLQWSWSAACAACRKTLGQDGSGMTPSEIRSAILGAEGEWRLAFRDPSAVAITAIKAIRGMTGIGLKEAKDAWDAGAASGAGLRGTRAECEALAARLRDDGVEADVMFAGASQGAGPFLPSPSPTAPRPGEGTSAVVIQGGSSAAIAVIKAIREAYGLGLKEAKDVWDAREAGDAIRGSQAQCEALSARLREGRIAHELRVPGAAPAPAPAPAGGNWVVRVTGGSEIGILAIKAIRGATGLGLKEAKDVWDRRGPGGALRGDRAWCERVQAALRKEGIEATATPT
ncbi:MAG: ribosomal protein L7/L12 [Planctomycetia bacterium]|nr:ribosomal protein L7/L12 [Planctomycetia bacterium]